jgi:hypothetical protein
MQHAHHLAFRGQYTDTSLKSNQPSTICLLGRAVAFRIYDLDNTGHIERGEVQRFLVALLKDNPAIDLDDAHLNVLIDQVLCVHHAVAHSPGRVH